MHLPPPSSFQPPPSSLQRHQCYEHKNIACIWAISPSFGWKIQSCPFWLKTSTHGIFEWLIPNSELHFCNSDPKINFWAKLGRKKKSSFYLKISTHGISRMLIFIPTLVFWISNPKSIFRQICVKKFKVVCTHRILKMWFLFGQ